MKFFIGFAAGLMMKTRAWGYDTGARGGRGGCSKGMKQLGRLQGLQRRKERGF